MTFAAWRSWSASKMSSTSHYFNRQKTPAPIVFNRSKSCKLCVSTVNYVHNSPDFSGGNSSSMKLWMEIGKRAGVNMTIQTPDILSTSSSSSSSFSSSSTPPRGLWASGRAKKREKSLGFYDVPKGDLRGFGSWNHQTVFQSRVSF